MLRNLICDILFIVVIKQFPRILAQFFAARRNLLRARPSIPNILQSRNLLREKANTSLKGAAHDSIGITFNEERTARKTWTNGLQFFFCDLH
jgi:hypothetical protein